ncbi:MAG: hypothetical protein KDD64_01625 [Bdellovibrionales bacterium]|nr:hypothetical protein [Bdellovibrionales bacterium]
MTNSKAKSLTPQHTAKVLPFRPGPYSKLQSQRDEGGSPEYAQAWGETVAELRGQQFSNLEQAIEMIVEKVLHRLNALGDDQEMRNFLYNLLEMDPVIVSEIRKNLKIAE